MASVDTVRLGITGLVGYARAITERLLGEGARTDLLKLVAVTAPDQDQHAARLAELADQGVESIASYEQMLERDDIDAVWLPLPIDLHRSFAERALEADKAVMCEKPVAATVQDVDAMIAKRNETGLPVAIGFNDLYDPSTFEIKSKLLAGVLGEITEARVMCCWPRGRSYFQRSGWAGRVQRQEQWVLDSPAANAMSHFIHLALFFLGDRPETTATPLDARAELYRVNPIENYDTCSLRYRVRGDGEVNLNIWMTHACQKNHGPFIHLIGERGRLEWSQAQGGQFFLSDGCEFRIACEDSSDYIGPRFARYVGGEEVPVATLEMGRNHVLAMNGASDATRICTIPEQHVEDVAKDNGDHLRILPGIESVFDHCLATGQMLSEAGLLPWTAPPGQCDLRDYGRFTGRMFTEAVGQP